MRKTMKVTKVTDPKVASAKARIAELEKELGEAWREREERRSDHGRNLSALAQALHFAQEHGRVVLAETRRQAQENQELRDRATFGDLDAVATEALLEHVDPDAFDLAAVKLKKHVLSLDEDEIEKPKEVFEVFAKEFAKKHPKYAKSKRPAKTTGKKSKPARRRAA